MKICKVYRFEAAHQLAGWPPEHQCSKLHGHTYRVEVELEGAPRMDGTTPGAIIDFGRISEIWNDQVHRMVDHTNLNESTGLRWTTAEALSVWIHGRMSRFLRVSRVRVWETETGYAEYFGGAEGKAG